MDILRSIAGTVTVELTSADIPGAMDAIAQRGVIVFDSAPKDDLTLELTLRRSDYKAVSALCRKRGDGLRLCRRKGVYWTGKSLLSRPVLVIGLLTFLVSALYLPSRVFFVRIEGSVSVPARRILEAAENCGISFGASRRAVRSERVKNALLESVPELQWAGVNTYGCVAVISVRERAPEASGETGSGFGHIVAVRDGIITDCTATRGNLLCVPGQAVSGGEILISGFTDCGLTIRAEQAEGEVYARTLRFLDAVSPTDCLRAALSGEERKKISLLIGKKRINLWKDSGIWDTTCGRMYEKYYITLPGGFVLPAALTVERYQQRQLVTSRISEDAAKRLLTTFAEACLQQEMLAGRIESSELSFSDEDGCIRMAGEYVCVEMIGIMQRQQIGE